MKRTAMAASALTMALAAGVFATSAAASGPEFGRCLKKAVVIGEGYADDGCLKHVTTKAKYEWIPVRVPG